MLKRSVCARVCVCVTGSAGLSCICLIKRGKADDKCETVKHLMCAYLLLIYLVGRDSDWVAIKSDAHGKTRGNGAAAPCAVTGLPARNVKPLADNCFDIFAT